MENQNIDEITKFIKELNASFSSLESIVELIEVVNGKTMPPEQKQILSKMTGLSPTTKNEQTSWLFNFNFVDEVGDVFLVVTDKNSKNWVGIRWTPEGIIVYNKTGGYVEKYTDSYHQHNLTAYPSIKADVVINFNGNTTPFNAETSLSLVEDGGEYRLLASMKIEGVMAETPLIHTHLGMIKQSPVLLKLLTRLEAQKRQQPTQPKKENTEMNSVDQRELELPDTDPNGNLASLEAKINELTELVLNQHRVITHMSDMMSIVHFDLLRLLSHYRPTTPYYPPQQPPATPGFYPQPPATPVYPPHQPPFTPGSYPQQPKPSFNPQQQQPVMGNCAGMGQGLCRNPVPQQSSPTAGQMADHPTYWGNFANQNYSMGNMVNMGSNSVLDQMNGLNQRVKAQQQPTATKEEIKDQPNFRFNFLK